jgi:hypothetical protein
MANSNRIQELKQLRKLANEFLSFYKTEQQIKTKGWEKNLIKRNITLLKSTIQKINTFLHPEKVSQFLEATKYTDSDKIPIPSSIHNDLLKHFGTMMQQGSYFIMMDIVRCSPRVSYFNDLTWFRHGTIKDHIDYGLGKVDETVFEKNLPYQISNIEKLEIGFFSKPNFKDNLILVKAILALVKEDKFIPANILIITLIEGLVRKFCLLVYKKQHPEKSISEIDNAVYVGKSSFESLICETIWARDIPVLFADFTTNYAHTENPIVTEFEERFNRHKAANDRMKEKLSGMMPFIEEQKKHRTIADEELKERLVKFSEDMLKECDHLFKEEEKTIMIGLDIYLDFLVRKFKDDRNNIIHGKYSFFKEKWRSLVYLSALQTLISKINWYEENVSF